MAGEARRTTTRVRARSARAAMAAVIGVLVVILAPGTASAAGAVVPVLDCYTVGLKGAKTLVLGYTNSDPSARSIPLGSSNSLTPSRLQGAQPTTYESGSVRAAYTIQLTETEVKQGAGWQLDGTWLSFQSALGPAPQCSTSTELPADGNGTGTAVALGVAGVVGAAMLYRFRRRIARMADETTAGAA